MQTEKVGKTVTQLYIVLMFVVFPMFYTDKLFHITDDKKQFFLYITMIYAGILAILAVCNLRKDAKKDRQAKWQRENSFCAMFILGILLSTCAALEKREAVYGISERRLGALVMLGCIVAYLGVRKYGKFQRITMGSILIGSGVVYLCGILCACKVNFLYLQDGLANPELFLTPIGNTNFNASYLCLMLPVVMVLFMMSREVRFQIFYGMVLYLGFLFSFFIKTESSILCIWAILLLLLYFAIEKKVWFERYLQILFLYVLSAAGIVLLLRWIPDQLFPFDGLGKFLLSVKVVCLESVFFVILCGLYYWKKDKLRIFLLNIRKVIRNGVFFFAVIGILSCIAVNSIWCDRVDGTFLECLKLTDGTFNGRGYIWIRTIRRFFEIPWKNRIFGSGLNCFLRFIGEDYREEMRTVYEMLYVDPHNLYLQMFVTMGIAGVIGFFGLMFAILHKAFRRYHENQLQIIVILTICAYLFQGMVNSATIHTFPLLFVLLGLFNGDISRPSEEMQYTL